MFLRELRYCLEHRSSQRAENVVQPAREGWTPRRGAPPVWHKAPQYELNARQ